MLAPLSTPETDIIRHKYGAKQIGQLTELEMDAATPGLLIKIFTITGWNIPGGEVYADLEIEFRKQLREKYAEMNVPEIVFAFRTYGHLIEEYGKNLSPVLIDRLLGLYLAKRLEASLHEERLKSQNDEDGFLASRSADWFRGEIETAYQRFKAGERFLKLRPHPHWYKILSGDGLISPNYYRLRLSAYQKRLLHNDKTLADWAQLKSVNELFRLGMLSKQQNLYKR